MTTLTTKLQAKLNQLLAEYETASKDEKYWIGLEIDDLEKKLAKL